MTRTFLVTEYLPGLGSLLNIFEITSIYSVIEPVFLCYLIKPRIYDSKIDESSRFEFRIQKKEFFVSGI